MKRQSKSILLIVLVFVILSITLMPLAGCARTAKTRDELTNIVRAQLQLEKGSEAAVTYAGEYQMGTDALVWFIVENHPSVYYRAAECELLSDGSYGFKKIHTPNIYSRDVVHSIWKAQDIFLVNNTECKTIVYMNEAGDIVSQTELSPDDYPYVFNHVPIGKVTSFLDSQGNEIQ